MRSVVAEEVAPAEGVGVIDVLELKTEIALDGVEDNQTAADTSRILKSLQRTPGRSSGLFFARWTKSAEGLILLDRPEARVCLLPFGRVCPLLAGVQLVEDREESRLLHFAVRNSASDLIEAIKNALADGARGGNHHDERLTARGGGLFHNLVEAAILYRVELVNDYGVRIQAVPGC